MSDFIIINLAEFNKAISDPRFTLKCSECGKIESVEFEMWEEMDRYDVFDHFICKSCTDNNYIIRSDDCDNESPF